MSDVYQALVAKRSDSGLSVGFEQLGADQIGDGDVEVAVEYSTLNYKDGLAISDAIPIVQAPSLILGIDMAGTVVSSQSDRFRVGDRVVLNGYGASETHNGGYTQRLRTRSEYLVPLPSRFATKQAMIIGTAGYTAMLSIMRLESLGIMPESGEVLVTGASGGVGTVAIMLLATMGYRVTASTGRLQETEFLKSLGATAVIDRNELSEPGEMMQEPRWIAAVDSCGSHTLANVLARMHYDGVVTACGLAQGLDLPGNMMPFALRNVALLGVDSVHAPMQRRQEAWERLAKTVDMEKLEALAVDIPFAQIPEAAGQILQGQIRGRAVVDIAGAQGKLRLITRGRTIMKMGLEAFSLAGKVAVVTGAGAGIGAAVARCYADAGAAVALTDIDAQRCEAVAAELREQGAEVFTLTMDVSRESDWEQLCSALEDWKGRWDVLLNNAGIYIGGSVESNTTEQLQRIHDINVASVFLGTRFAAAAMKPGGTFGHGGSIINLSSIAGLIGVPGHSIYGASKGAVASFSRHAAVEFARFGYGVRVNSLHPGLIDTAMGHMVLQDFVDVGLAPDTDTALSMLRDQMIPSGRLGTVEDVANAALFLAAEASSYVTGTELTVDGGFVAA